MSEDAPKPQDVPEAADVKPLNYIDHEPGIFASENDPEYVDPDSPSTVHDIEKAKAMALAENEGRSAAAKIRSAANGLDFYPEQAGEIQRDIDNLGPEPEVTSKRPFKRAGQEQDLLNYRHRKQQLEDELGEIDERLEERLERPEVMHRAGFSSSMLENAKASLHDPEARGEIERWIDHFRSHARNADRRAAVRGRFAGVLHDKPVSEAYKEAHPFEDAYDSVDGLMLITYASIPELRDEVAKLRQEVKEKQEGPPTDLILDVGLIEATREELTERYLKDVVAPPALEVYQDLLDKLAAIEDESTTVGDIRGLVRLIPHKLIEANEAHIRYAEGILHDVLKGRASQPPEPTETQEAA